MDKPYAFISYSKEDRAFVERLSAALNAAGVATWIDVQNIAAGTNWDDEVQSGLLKASALIYVVSQNAANSKWMESELESFLAEKGSFVR